MRVCVCVHLDSIRSQIIGSEWHSHFIISHCVGPKDASRVVNTRFSGSPVPVDEYTKDSAERRGPNRVAVATVVVKNTLLVLLFNLVFHIIIETFCVFFRLRVGNNNNNNNNSRRRRCRPTLSYLMYDNNIIPLYCLYYVCINSTVADSEKTKPLNNNIIKSIV